jgi:hypothetical protein
MEIAIVTDLCQMIEPDVNPIPGTDMTIARYLALF